MMSMIGLDIGNESCTVAAVTGSSIDIVLNDECKHQTPTVVCFGEEQRFIGSAEAAASSTMNPNSISQIKRLIGRRYSDPVLQSELKFIPFTVTEGSDGYPLINVHYLGEAMTFTPTQLLAMVLSHLKSMVEKKMNAPVVDCCIGIPVYFTDLQRRSVMDAATIAGLKPLCLFHETTASALQYGVYKADLPKSEDSQLNVAFVDIGHASMQVCIATFKKGTMKILAHSFDECLGGRDFDEALFQHFSVKFKEECKINVSQNARACRRLRAACEKLKKVLSSKTEASVNIECLIGDKDVSGFIKRVEFEQACVPVLERLKRPLEKALAEAGNLTVENVHMVEVVGAGSRVPAIIDMLKDFFCKEPTQALNASESIAKGCALRSAIFCPIFKVQKYQVYDVLPFPVTVSWLDLAANRQNVIVFPKGNPIPSLKALSYYRTEAFPLDVHILQDDDLGEQQALPSKVSTYMIGLKSTSGERVKVKVKACLNVNGIVSLESATVLKEEEVDRARKVKKTSVPVAEFVYGGMSEADVQKARKKEFEMASQDRQMET